MVRVYLLCLVPFYQAYYTLFVRYCYITGTQVASYELNKFSNFKIHIRICSHCL